MRPYLQSTEYTTAAASLVWALHQINGHIANSWVELDIWHHSALLPTRASSVYGLALYAKKKGLTPNIIIQKQQYSFPDYRFFRYKKTDIDIAADMQDYYRRAAINEDIPVIKKKITIDLINSLKDRTMLVRLNPKAWRGHTTSNFVVLNVLEQGYKIMDPKVGILCITKQILESSLKQLVDKKKRDPQILVL